MDYNKIVNTKILLVLFLIFSNCKNKEKQDIVSDSEQKSIKEKTETLYSISFPDTVIVNRKNKGLIEYKSSLDTIKLSDKDKRYVFFYVGSHKDTLELKNLLKVKHDTFVSVGNGRIPIYNFSFKEKGNNYIDGYIEDQVVLFNHDGQEDKSRIITHTSRVIKPVYVVDSLKVIDLKKTKNNYL